MNRNARRVHAAPCRRDGTHGARCSTRRKLLFALRAAMLGPPPSFAQQHSRIPLIGVINSVHQDALREGLLEHGWIDGAKPGDLPVEQPTKVELTLNHETANAAELRCPLPCYCAPTE